MRLLHDPSLEADRLALQARLDAAKTAAQRNELGQFATPTALALDILRYARSLTPREQPVRFLDPAIGTGSFYSALLEVFPCEAIASAVGYEIDSHYGEPTRSLWSDRPLDLRLTDFTTATPPDERLRATLLICNPPYVRHHHLRPEEKRRLQAQTQAASGMRLSGLAGLYCHFLGSAHAWMAEGCLAGWLIPSEFMDVNYGAEVKRYLLDEVTLLHIHRFDPSDAQFDDALVSSAVVWFRNEKPPTNHRVEFSFGGTLHHPRRSAMVEADALRTIAKWTRLPTTGAAQLNGHQEPRLADLFTIRRGLVTGGNDFFILSPEQIAEHRLPTAFLRPILPSPRHLAVDEIETDPHGNPLTNRPRFLLDCRLPEADVKNGYPELWAYLQKGVAQGVADGYLCRHRSPWYAQEERPAAPIVCTYMGRQGAKGRPFRFIINYSQATAANVYLMLYPKQSLEERLRARPEHLRAIWSWLNELDTGVVLGEGRVYGGGLHKLEPKELANLPVGSLTDVLGMRVERWVQPSLP